MKIRANKVIIALAAGACALAILPSAQAAAIPVPPNPANLSPNNANLNGGSLVPGGTLLNQAYGAGAFTGTVSTWVLQNTTENPAGYTFVYQINNTGTDPASSVGFGTFPGFTTSVGNNWSGGALPALGGAYPIAGILAADTANRIGDTVNFFWGNGLPGATASTYLVVETSATDFTPSTAGINDKVGYTANDFAPAPNRVTTPDGGCTLMLLGSALSGLAFLRRKVS